MFVTRQWDGKIERRGDDRIVVLPAEVILEGTEIRIVQDKWGEISIHPTSEEGRAALMQFGPFADWDDDEHGKA